MNKLERGEDFIRVTWYNQIKKVMIKEGDGRDIEVAIFSGNRLHSLDNIENSNFKITLFF